MNRRLRTIWSLACTLPVAFAGTSALAAPPRSLNVDVTSARSLNESQLDRVRDYASYWIAELATSEVDPMERAGMVETARQELVKPLGRLAQPSEAFRFEYSKQVLRGMSDNKLLDGPDAHRSVNAILVATELGSSAALRQLARRCDARDELRPYVRQRAAIGCMVILKGATEQPARLIIEERDVDNTVRLLRDAAMREENSVVLRRQFEAMLGVQNGKAYDHLAQALDAVVGRIAEAQPGNEALIEPIHVVVLRLRDRFLNLNGLEQRQLGTVIGPRLGRLLETIEAQWQIAQGEVALKDTYGELVDLCEKFLKQIHLQVQNGGGVPQAGLKEAWDSGDQPKYSADVQLWIEQLNKPPYK